MDTLPPDDDRLRRLARAASLALDPIEYADLPRHVVVHVRNVCSSLPETVENPAWAGIQWRIRKRTFAHVLAVDFPDGPMTAVTFRSHGAELVALRRSGHPFFRPAWGVDAVGTVLDADVDWAVVGELLIESYCILAPKKLVALVDRPPGERR